MSPSGELCTRPVHKVAGYMDHRENPSQPRERQYGHAHDIKITITHITFSMAYVAVIVQSRLMDMDISLEEAAMDLGAKPAKVFFVITLPIIAPALVSGW